MAHPHTELLEIILRECAAAGTHPWYPAVFANSTGVPREPLEASLDQLRLNGLVQLTPWVQGQGQGYQLTPHGAEVLQHPRLLDRLRQGEVPQAPPQTAPSLERHALAGMRGEKVRDALVDDSRPLVTQVLLVANIFWFLVGSAVYLHLGGDFPSYLGGGGAQLSKAYHEIGSLGLVDLVFDHQWWRLLSYGFIHGGLLHLFMNMYALFVIGPLLERMWGRAAYLAIYLVSCVGGGACAVILTPQGNLVGASGAICGLLGSMLTWLLLNKAHLPPHLVSNWQRSIMTNIILIAILSIMPGVSWAGHLGGGVTGALVAAPLNLARFGEGVKRGLGWAGMLAITVVGLCWTYIEVHRQPGNEATAAENPAGRVEVLRAKERDLPILFKADEIAKEAWKLESIVLRAEHQRPEEPRAQEIRGKLLALEKQLEQAAIKLSTAGPFHHADLAATMKTGAAYLDATSKLCGKTAKVLDPDGPWPPPNLKALRAERLHVEELYKSLLEAWRPLKQFLEGS